MPSEGRRPLGLTLLLWLYAFWAAASGLALAAAALGSGDVAIDGQAVRRQEALERALPVFLPLALAFGGGALALSLRRPWARAALLLPLALAAVLPVLVAEQAGFDPARRLLTGSGVMALPILLLAWYLYRRPAVVAHFDTLREERE